MTTVKELHDCNWTRPLTSMREYRRILVNHICLLRFSRRKGYCPRRENQKPTPYPPSSRLTLHKSIHFRMFNDTSLPADTAGGKRQRQVSGQEKPAFGWEAPIELKEAGGRSSPQGLSPLVFAGDGVG